MNGIRFQIGVGLVAALFLSTSAAAQQVEMVISGIEFTTGTAMDVIEQDVLIEKNPGSGDVYRPGPMEAEPYRDAPAYAQTQPMPHSWWSPGTGPT